MNFCNLWKTCEHAACRRAGACRSPEVACFLQERDEIRETILSYMFVFPFVDKDRQVELDAETIDDLVASLEWE